MIITKNHQVSNNGMCIIYVLNENYIHSDIKHENIIITQKIEKDGIIKPIMKIIDFGGCNKIAYTHKNIDEPTFSNTSSITSTYVPNNSLNTTRSELKMIDDQVISDTFVYYLHDMYCVYIFCGHSFGIFTNDENGNFITRTSWIPIHDLDVYDQIDIFGERCQIYIDYSRNMPTDELKKTI